MSTSRGTCETIIPESKDWVWYTCVATISYSTPMYIFIFTKERRYFVRD